METLADVVSLISDIFLVFLGIYISIVIMRVYSLYRSLGFSRTVITPFLFVGVLFAFSGITELLGVFIGKVGSVIHSLNMVVTGVFLVFGLRGYNKMLMKAREGKRLSETNRRT